MNENIKRMVENVPATKISERTKVREILQQTALLALERQGFFEHAAFYGGTALRILYGLDRFSEDLDFTLLKPNPDFNFKPFLSAMKTELASFGFDMDVEQKEKTAETSVLSAFMKINTIKLYLAIGDEKAAKKTIHNEKVQIKLEIDINPPCQFRLENKIVLNPTTFYVLSLEKGDLFAGKMHAILYRAWKGRVKGRDWYDLIWYVQEKIPLNLYVLEAYMKQAGNLPVEVKLGKTDLINLLTDKIKKIDWNSAKDDMRTFIPDPERLDIWSAKFFLDVIENIIVTN